MSKFGFDSAPVRLSLVNDKTIEEYPQVFDEVLDYALRYAELGWHVIPVRKDKTPISGHGLNSATKDPALIRKIWQANPDAGIAIACEKSGLVVLDIDPRNGGLESLAQLEAEHGIIYSSVVSQTQGGGEHRVFKANAAATYPGTLGAGLDLKYRGYILVEPSRGENGVYKWQSGKNPTQGSLPTDAPALFGSKPSTSVLSLAVRPGSVVVATEVYADLERALKVIPPESDYVTWFKVLQGLSRLADKAEAYRMAKAWSLKSSNPEHTEAAFNEKWRTCMHEDYVVSYASVFYTADQYNAEWRVAAPADPEPCAALWSPVDLAGLQLEAVDYLIDDFLAHALMVFVGKPGMGKSTAMIALAAIVAGFRLPECPLTAPVVGRKIIYITEDTDQFKRNLIALNRNFGLSIEELARAFVLLPAQRVQAKDLLGLLAIVEENTVTHADTNVVLRPWLVFDTTSASFHLEDENSNAEVAAVLALLKAEFYEKLHCSVCMVAHSHKHSTRQEFVADPRGAGAWAGDTTLTSGIFEEDEQRFIMLGKRRYSPRNTELRVELRTQYESLRDAYGRVQVVELDSVKFDWSSTAERLSAKESAQEVAAQHKEALVQSLMWQLVRAQPLRGFNFYVDMTQEAGGVGYSKPVKTRALNALIDSGEIDKVEPEIKRGRAAEVLLVNEERYVALHGNYGI